jgi:hypothetical protein
MFRCTRVPIYNSDITNVFFFFAFVLLSLRQVTIIKKTQRKNEKRRKRRWSLRRIPTSVFHNLFRLSVIIIHLYILSLGFFSSSSPLPYLGLMHVCVFFLLLHSFQDAEEKRKKLNCQPSADCRECFSSNITPFFFRTISCPAICCYY